MSSQRSSQSIFSLIVSSSPFSEQQNSKTTTHSMHSNEFNNDNITIIYKKLEIVKSVFVY